MCLATRLRREDSGKWVLIVTSHRLFPIAVPHKMLFIEYMLSRGINAYRGATQLRYVAPPEGGKHAENSRWLMDHIVYMPIHSGMSEKDIRLTITRSIDAY